MQAETRAEKLYTKIREVLHGAVESAEDKLGMVSYRVRVTSAFDSSFSDH